MHVGVIVSMVCDHGVDDGTRLLRRGGVVEIDERLAIDFPRQDRKIRPDRLEIIRLRRRVHSVHPRRL